MHVSLIQVPRLPPAAPEHQMTEQHKAGGAEEERKDKDEKMTQCCMKGQHEPSYCFSLQSQLLPSLPQLSPKFQVQLLPLQP